MASDITLEKIIDLAKEADQTQWCPNYCYTMIRHVVRNCDFDVMCDEHKDQEWGCEGFGKYDGPYIAAVCPANLLPLLNELKDLRARLTP